jgi:hypothetical protein
MKKNKMTFIVKLSITVDPHNTLDVKAIAPCIIDELEEWIVNTNTDDEVLVEIDSIKRGK